MGKKSMSLKRQTASREKEKEVEQKTPEDATTVMSNPSSSDAEFVPSADEGDEASGSDSSDEWVEGEAKEEETQVEEQGSRELPSNPDVDPYLLNDLEFLNQYGEASKQWRNKQRTLVFCTRGIAHRSRHLMEDIKKLLPHHKSEPKWEKKQTMSEINELCEDNLCNNCVFFESRRHTELFMWLSKTPHGPSIKFQVLNVHTMDEIKMAGNCLLHSRPLLAFDGVFDSSPHMLVMKELLVQALGTPRNHPKSKPFFDHVFSFLWLDNKIWFRHYQISPVIQSDVNKPSSVVLTEIGPRFVLDPIRIFAGSFSGAAIYSNPHYLSPMEIRRLVNLKMGGKYRERVAAKRRRAEVAKDLTLPEDPLEFQKVFQPPDDIKVVPKTRKRRRKTNTSTNGGGLQED